MKKIFTICFVALLALGMTACNSSRERTIANLKSAIDGETEAAARYEAYARQAEAEGYNEVAALFKATSAAEGLHIRNHRAVLENLGVADYVAAIPDITVGATADNLRTAVEGEKYENDSMYPAFIKEADKEKAPEAVTSFTYAREAENGHSVLYAQALENLNNPGVLETVYHVCPQCGNTYAGEAEETCSVCGTPASSFTVFEAQLPATETAETVNSETAASEVEPATLG